MMKTKRKNKYRYRKKKSWKSRQILPLPKRVTGFDFGLQPSRVIVNPQMNWFSRMGKDSAANPFVLFGKDRLGLRGVHGLHKIKKKNLTWEQARRRYPKLSPFGDADHDSVINMFDCKPFDKKRQDTPVGRRVKLRKINRYEKSRTPEKRSDLEKAMDKYQAQEKRKIEVYSPISSIEKKIKKAKEKTTETYEELRKKQRVFSGDLKTIDQQIEKNFGQIKALQKDYKKARGKNKEDIRQALLEAQDRLTKKEEKKDELLAKSTKKITEYAGKLEELKEKEIAEEAATKTPEYRLKKEAADVLKRKIERTQKGGFLEPGIRGQIKIQVEREKKKLGDYGRLIQVRQLGTEAAGDFGRGVGKALTKKYSPKMRATAAKVHSATFRLLDALTETGGIGEAVGGESHLTNIGPGGGLARVKQKMAQTRGKVGRPYGTYKYGIPIQQIKAMEREKKRQIAMQQFRMMQQQMPKQVPVTMPQRPMPVPMPTETQTPEESFSDDQTQMMFNEMTEGSFVTPELVQSAQPVPQFSQQFVQGQPAIIQGEKTAYARVVPQTSLQRGNPFNLKAKYRPNFSYNPFKFITQNLFKGKPLLTSTRPATTTSQLKEIKVSPLSTTTTNTLAYRQPKRREAEEEIPPTKKTGFVYENGREGILLE